MTSEGIGFRVSTYSAGTGNCVEVGQARDTVLVRDTKNRPAGVLTVSPAAWSAFLSSCTQ